MSDMEKKLTFRLLGDTSGLSNSLKNAQTETDGLGAAMKKLGSIVATVFTVGSIVKFGKSVVDVGRTFEAQMAKVQAISGATSEELVLLEAEARRLGATTMFSATDAGKGLEYFAMAGWSVDDAISALEPTLRLAQASGEDLGLTADIVSDAMTAFGMKATEAGKFTDLLASASTSSNTNVALLGESFKYVAPLIGAVRGSADDTAFALGLMANAGIKGSQAGTALRSAMTNLIDPTKEMQKAMNQYGVQAIYTDDGSLNLKATLDNLRGTFSQLTPEQQAQASATIFGKEAMSGMLAIVNASAEDYDKLTLATSDYNGTAMEMARIMEDNVQGSIFNLQSAWEEIQLVLYGKIAPVLKLIIDRMTDGVAVLTEKIKNGTSVFNRLGDAVKWSKENMDIILPIIAGVTSAIASQSIINAISKLYKAWKTITEAQSIAQTILNGVMNASPFGLVATSIGLLVTAGILLYKNWDAVSAKAIELKDIIVSAFASLKDTAVKKFEEIKTNITDVFTGLAKSAIEWGENLVEGLWNGIESLKAWLQGKITGFVEGIGNVITSFFGIASPAKLMILYGQYIDEGLALGIQNNAKKPISAMENLTNAVDGAFQKVNSSVKNTIGVIQKEFQLWQTLNTNMIGSSEELRLQLEAQKKEHALLAQQIEVAQAAFTKMSEIYGETSDQALNYKNQLLDLQIQQAKLTGNIKETTDALNGMVDAQLKARIEAFDKQNNSSSSGGGSSGGDGGAKFREERENFYDANKSEIDSISKKQGVDLGVAQEIYRNNLKNVPKLATGGIITKPTLAMVGEGAESEAVLPLSKLDSLLGGGGSVNGLVVNIYGSVGVDDIGEQIVQTLRRKGVMSFA